MISTIPHDYITDSSFERVVASGSGMILVVIVADWSGSCHLMAPIFQKLSEEFQEYISIYKMDHDSNTKTMATFRVHDLPTILFFQDGQLVDQMLGTASKSELISRIQSFL